MAIVCVCPICDRKIRVDDAIAGKVIRCPECSEAVDVPKVDRSVLPTPRPTTPKSKSSKKGEKSTPSAIPPAVWAGAALALVAVTAMITGGIVFWLKSEPGQKPDPELAAANTDGGQSPHAIAEKAAAAHAASQAAVAAEATPSTTVAAAVAPASPGVADLSAFVTPETPPEPEPMAEEPSAAESPAAVAATAPAGPAEEAAAQPANPVAAVEAPGIDPPMEKGKVSPELTKVTIANTAPLQAQAHAVTEILTKACYRCHGESGTNEGGMNYIVSLDKVRQSLVKPGDPDASTLMKRIATADSEQVMPPKGETPALTPENVATIRQWIESGAAIPETKQQRKFVTDERIVTAVHADLLSTPDRSRRFIRYFTLCHLYNAGVSDDELETYRLAFSKLINSLSWGRQLVTPHRVDEVGTILRVDIRDMNWGSEIWEQIVGVNPYPYDPHHEYVEKIHEQCESQDPWVRVDWFVFKASRPPLYHQILRIPETEDELELLLHVDAKTNIEQEKVVRAGFNRSGVSRNNRLIERHEISQGAYWKSYDFAANTGRQNLFDYPGGPEGDDSFAHDGGELIFNLPNGLLGFMLTDSKGSRLESGPTAIVSDPATHDRTVVNGLSCFSCHYAGFIRKEDEIRPFLDLNAKSFDNSDYLKAIYPGQAELDKHYAADGAAYLKALSSLGITNTSRAGEPISSMSQRFQTELSASQAAAEFGMTEVEFRKCLETHPDMPRSLGALRVAGGTLKRDAFTSIFRDAMQEMRTAPRPSNGESTKSAPAVKVVDRIPIPNIRASNLAMNSDGSRVAIGVGDNGIMLVDTKAGKSLGSAISTHDLSWRQLLRFSPKGDHLLVSGRDGVIQVWDVNAAGQLTPGMEFTGHSQGGRAGEIQKLVVSQDGDTVLSCCSNRQLHAWSIRSGKSVRSFPEGLKTDLLSCWISADGRDVQLSDNQVLASFSTRNARIPNQLDVAPHAASFTAFSPNGKLLAAVGRDGILLVNSANGKEVARIPMSDRDPIVGLFFIDQGRCLVIQRWRSLAAWKVSDQKSIPAPQSSAFNPSLTIATALHGDLCAWIESEGSGSVLRLERISESGATTTSTSKSPSTTKKAGKIRWKVGDKAETLDGSRWSPVTVLKINPDDTVRIHWDGWSDSFDEDRDPSRLRRIETPAPKSDQTANPSERN